jgi:hypothetical protein
VDVLEVAVGKRGGAGAALGLAGRCCIDVGRSFRFVLVDNQIALVVVSCFQEPLEDSGRVGWISDTPFGTLPIDAGDIILGDGAPVHVAGRRPLQALDAGEEAFDPRSEAPHAVGANGWRLRIGHPVAAAVLTQCRDQILRVRKDERIGLVGIVIARQPFFGLTADRRHTQRPLESERSITRAWLIAKRELRPESRAARRGDDGHGERRHTGDRVGGELFAKTRDGTSSFGERKRRHKRISLL